MHLQQIQSKIFRDFSDFQPLLEKWRDDGEKIVFTNGCFDLLHRGHLEYLASAADLGNRLVIGLNSDRSVTGLKGSGRPLTDETARSLIIASLSFVSAVILFDEETPAILIKKILPDFLVKGSDYSIHEIAGNDVVTAAGGKVETIALLEGYSTTQIIEKIKTQP